MLCNLLLFFDDIYFQISIREATGLPPAFSNFVFCQYTAFGEREATIVPYRMMPQMIAQNKEGATLKFGFEKVCLSSNCIKVPRNYNSNL